MTSQRYICKEYDISLLNSFFLRKQSASHSPSSSAFIALYAGKSSFSQNSLNLGFFCKMSSWVAFLNTYKFYRIHWMRNFYFVIVYSYFTFWKITNDWIDVFLTDSISVMAFFTGWIWFASVLFHKLWIPPDSPFLYLSVLTAVQIALNLIYENYSFSC